MSRLKYLVRDPISFVGGCGTRRQTLFVGVSSPCFIATSIPPYVHWLETSAVDWNSFPSILCRAVMKKTTSTTISNKTLLSGEGPILFCAGTFWFTCDTLLFCTIMIGTTKFSQPSPVPNYEYRHKYVSIFIITLLFCTIMSGTTKLSQPSPVPNYEYRHKYMSIFIIGTLCTEFEYSYNRCASNF